MKFKKALTGWSIYLLGCVVAYPLTKYEVTKKNREQFPSLYSWSPYTKEEKEWVLGLCVFSWVSVATPIIAFGIDKISDSISQNPKW